jgi:hypothetical protein
MSYSKTKSSASHSPKDSIFGTLFNIGLTASAYAGVSALAVHRQIWMPKIEMPNTRSDRVFNWCTSDSSVSAELAKNPNLSPQEASKSLFGSEGISISEKKPPVERVPATAEDLERAYQCGKFGPTRPSELFLRIFHDALVTLESDPLMGVVSPSLMGSCGAIPLTVIGPLADICRHMSNLIARAEREVFLATNYWMDSASSKLITDSLKELSKRAGERGGRVVVKIMYDRGNPKQVSRL